MKNIKYTVFALLSLSLFMTGCMNDNFDTPSNEGYKPYSGDAVNTTIKDLKTKYATAIDNSSIALIDKGTIIEGTVISTDEHGNFYQQLILQDATGAIQISVSGKGQHIYYPIGQKVVVKCDSLYIGGYGAVALIGMDYYNTSKGKHQVGRMNQAKEETALIPDGKAAANNLPTPKEINKYNDLTKDDINTLVTLKNVSFDDAQYKTFAPETEQDGGYAVDRDITFAGGGYTIVRTSSYANFANIVLPGGTGDLTGVLGYYNGTYQFIIRDYTTDVGKTFVPYDKTRTPLYSETLANSLGSMTANHVTSATAPDIADWTYSSSYKCAVATGYVNKTNLAVESYLVSPTIDLSNVKQAFVSFKSAIAYATAATAKDNHQLLISTDYAGDPATATWTVVPARLHYSTSGSFDFGSTGKIGIPGDFVGKKVYFALRYKSTTKASTWEVKDFMVDEGKGSLILYDNGLYNDNGGFTSYSVTGAQTWNLKTTYGFKISGFNKTNLDNQDWAVSPAINLAGTTAPSISFDQAINYAKGNDLTLLHTLWITDSFTGDPSTTTWTQLTIPVYPTGNDWTYVNSGSIPIPTSFAGKKVYFGFKYTSNTNVATTWEVKNISIVDL